ncbi:VWA domain-containing protein [bacterium]|nr:VWA domain-containing protein [bacterium]
MKEKETISFLVKEFEQRKAAELYAKINVAKTGVIDTNKLHTYKYNDDIFRRIATIPKGKNHGFVMFLDWSGSMTHNLKNTLKQLFSLCLFCKQIGVPFEVYAFKDCGCDNPFSYLNKENVIAGGNLVLRNFLSSRMNVEEFNFAMTCLWFAGTGGHLSTDGMGGTPLNEALMIAPKIINDFKARNKLEITNVIVLTDGESNPSCGIKNETTPRVHGQNRKYFYVDPATRKTYDWQPYGWSLTESNTNTLLRIIKDNTGCNLVGFYLYDGSFKRLDNQFNVSNYNPEAFLKARKYWNENKYYPIRSVGYDEYYVIDSNALRNTNNELAIDNTGDKKMTTKKMVSAFTKFAQKKTVNRVLLRQFSERIAGHSKKVA